MIIYWFIWFFVCVGNIFLNIRKILSQFLFLILFFILFIFIGFRYRVGADWGNYLNMYDRFQNVSFWESLFISEPAYSLLNYISQYLNLTDTILVNSVCALILCIFLYLSFKKMKEYWLLILMYYPYHILSVSLGYTRQAVALAIIIYALTFLMDKKILKSIILIIFSSFFHKTTIIFLLFLPIIFIKKKYMLSIYKILSLIFIFVVLYISFLLENNIYLNSDYELSSSGVFMRLSMHIIPLFLYMLYYKKIFRVVLNEQLYILNYFILLIFLCCFLAIPFSTLSDRFNLYLVFFDLFVVSTIYPYLVDVNKKIVLFVLIVYYTLFIYIWLVYGEWASKAWVPYSNYVSNYLFERVF